MSDFSSDDNTPYLSDEFERDEVQETLLDLDNRVARREELAGRLEDLVAEALDWAQTSQDEDAQEIYEALSEVYERLSAPLENPDDETGMVG